MHERNKRPVFLNLTRIQMPVNALLSIGHRISGIFLFLALPVLIYLLDISLQSPEGYKDAADLLSSPGLRVIELLGIWMLSHHLFAGIRYLLLDLKIGLDRTVARVTAWLVHAGGLIVLLISAGCMFL